jgi:DNA-binding transcriptional regulator YiaG
MQYVTYSAHVTPDELKRRRRAGGLTQRELAEQVGVATNSVARWEQGRLGISVPAQRLLAIILPDDGPPPRQRREGRKRRTK